MKSCVHGQIATQMRQKSLIHRFPQYQDRFRSDLVADLYRNENSAIIGHFLALGMVIGFKHDSLPLVPAIIWAIAVASSVVFRALCFRRFRKRSHYDASDLHRHTIAISACAMAWSLGFLAILPTLNGDDRAFFMMVFAGITSSAVVTLSARLKSYAMFSSLVLGPPVVGMFFAPQPDYAMATMAAIFFLFCGIGVKKANLVHHSAMIRRYQNSDIMKDLGAAKKDLQVAVKKAESANQAKQEFLANVSHEIRTPMNGILGMTDLVLESELTEDQQTCLQTARRCGLSLLHLIDELLDFSKIEAGKMDMEMVPFDLNAVLADTVEVHRLSGRAKAEILLDVDKAIPEQLLGDPNRMRQVVNNLLGNAVKFTPKGYIRVSARVLPSDDGKHQLQLSVADEGVGIPEDRLESIFESFTQADGSTTRNYGGTGLGLTITRSLIELMGGNMSVESEVGVGSTFHATVPLKDATRKSLASPCAVLAVGKDAESLAKILPLAGAEACAAELDGELWNVARDCYRDVHAHRFLFLDRASFEQNTELLTAFLRHFRCTAVFTDCAPAEETPAPYAILDGDLDSSFLEKLIDRCQAEKEQAEAVPEEKEVGSLRILVAEDHPTNALIVRRMLEGMGHDVTHAPDGKQAVQAFQKGGADLILMDLQMPVMGGHDACRAIRALPDGKEIPILALTAHATSEERERSRESGMDDHLTKPFTRDQLTEALKAWGSRTHSSSTEA